MPIQPLDLQTLFAHLNQIGKDQANIKEGAVLQQNVKGNELVKETQHKDESVNNLNTMKDENNRIKDNPEKQSGNSGNSLNDKNEENKKENAGESGKTKKKYYTDPNLGKNIDITG